MSDADSNVQMEQIYHAAAPMDNNEINDEQQMQANKQMQLFNAKKKCGYEILARNNFHLPDRKAAICIQKFLKELYDGLCFCYTNDQIVVLACYKAPPVKYLNHMTRVNLGKFVEKGVQQAMPKQKSDSIKRLIEHLSYRSANASYLISILATLQKREGIPCEIFEKNYLYFNGKYNPAGQDSEDGFHFQSGAMKRSEQDFFGNLPKISIVDNKHLNRIKPREQVLIDQMNKDQQKMLAIQARLDQCKNELQGQKKQEKSDIRPKRIIQENLDKSHSAQIEKLQEEKRQMQSQYLGNAANNSLSFRQQPQTPDKSKGMNFNPSLNQFSVFDPNSRQNSSSNLGFEKSQPSTSVTKTKHERVTSHMSGTKGMQSSPQTKSPRSNSYHSAKMDGSKSPP